MPGIFDLLTGGDPTMAMLQRLGQAPGQPGSPAGPMPLAGAQAAPGGPQTAAATPGGPNASGPPGAVPGAPSGAPTPQQQQMGQTQAYTSPTDLVSMYAQLAQNQIGAENFNRNIGLLAAGFARPRDRALILQSMSGRTQDPGELMGNIVKLTQFNQEQQRYQAQQAAIPAIAKTLYPTEVDEQGNSTQGALQKAGMVVASGQGGTVLSNLAGVGGSPEWQSQVRAENAKIAQGVPPEQWGWTPKDPVSFGEYQKEKTQANQDIVDAKDTFSEMKGNYTNLKSNMDWLKAHPDAVYTALTTVAPTSGTLGKIAGGIGAVDQDTLDAKTHLQLLGSQLYASNFRGTKQRLSQGEATRLGDQFTYLNSNAYNMSQGGVQGEINRLSDQIDKGAANVYARAGQEIPSDLAGQEDRIYMDPNSLFYAGAHYAKPDSGQAPGAQPGQAPALTSAAPSAAPSSASPTDLRASKDPAADYEKLPSGAVYIGPDGKPRRKS